VRKRLAVCAAAVASVAAASGCNTSSLSKRELVVHFSIDASAADHAAALAACSDVSTATVPEPMSTSSLPSQSVGDVRFRIDHANDRQVALLTECLDTQPGVVGVDTPDLTN
jgi:hypothetical protein